MGGLIAFLIEVSDWDEYILVLGGVPGAGCQEQGVFNAIENRFILKLSPT